MERTVLLSSIIDAFLQILLLPAIAGEIINRDDNTLESHTQLIITTLERAEGQLIREADKELDSDTPGSMLSPEAMTIAVISRLASGVCGPATLNVTGLYEHILEEVALAVKTEASRDLLRTLDGIEEELDVIVDVLKQQTSVLLQFRAALDPSFYLIPSIKRILGFQHESKSIDAVLIQIRETLRGFEELRERAKGLANENVRSVDVGQEKNSRYLFVFTLVTVIFLPLTVVAGYFGMNLKGVNPAPWGEEKYWEVATPLTLGTLLACFLTTQYM